MNIDDIVRKEVLLNAVTYGGKPNSKAIMGKILGKYKEYRSKSKEVLDKINEYISVIANKSVDELKNELLSIDPEALEMQRNKKKRQSEVRKMQKKSLADLPHAVKGKFKVRYAPDPSKYPHLGQGMNYLINRMYADKYDGKVVLRFDDTNPSIVKKEYYDAIKRGLLWLGATWDEEIRASQFLDTFYDIARKWISTGDLYVCTCNSEELSKNRENMIACSHRNETSEMHLQKFESMLKGDYKPGEAVIRLKGDMQSDNNVMRDPIMFRVVKDKHPMLDKFYPVFPTYDFESAYLDQAFGVTHIIRSGEFGTMRQELQTYLIKKFGGKVPYFKSFGRFNIQGCPTKGRVIRELVQNGTVSGWDDIRLITLDGLRKRGIHPMTPRLLIEEAGLTPKNTNIAWVTLEKKSRELLEKEAKRFFFVPNPIYVHVDNLPIKSIELELHPDHPEFGKRLLHISGEFWIDRDDISSVQEGDIIRLKDLCNIKITNIGKSLSAEYIGTDLIDNTKKIQWVTDKHYEVTFQVPDILEKEKGKINKDSLHTISGYFEENIDLTEPDDVIQMERVAYAKIDKNTLSGHFVHSIKKFKW